jgi:putative tricarboxylic transport membrane protein
MKKGEIVFSGVCVIFFGFMLFETIDLLGQGRPGEVGSGLWPFMALAVSMVLSLLMLIQSIRKNRAAGRERAPQPSVEDLAARKRQRTTVTLSILIFLAYILLMPFTGFILATLFYILAFAWALGERRRWVLAVSPFLVAAVIVGVFAKFITIPFPKGIGIFADFSRLFY